MAGDKSSNWLNDCEKKLKTAQCVGYISPVVVVGMSIRSLLVNFYVLLGMEVARMVYS